jgi:hypothetical protein
MSISLLRKSQQLLIVAQIEKDDDEHRLLHFWNYLHRHIYSYALSCEERSYFFLYISNACICAKNDANIHVRITEEYVMP